MNTVPGRTAACDAWRANGVASQTRGSGIATVVPVRWLAALVLLVATACASSAVALTPAASSASVPLAFPATASQGALVIGRVPAGSVVRLGERTLRVTPYGSVVFGIGRDASGPVALEVRTPDGRVQPVRIAVSPRDWPLERIDGVPPATVDPPPAIARRIRDEQARVAAVRALDDARADFAQRFVMPVEGRISGRFGRARSYNGRQGAPHSGMDIAAPAGTAIRAPAAGIVTFADPTLYLTGGTVVLDHGHGVSSNFLHLSRIDVRVGQRLAPGEVLGAVGATGRATGPHLHWGMNWFDVRVDPQLVLDRPG